MKQKKCKQCGESKTMTAFYPSQRLQTGQRRGDGRRAVCKACCLEKKRQWLAAMSPSQKRARRERRAKEYKRWAARHPHNVRASKANLHAQRVGAPGTLTEADVQACWDYYQGKCWVCGFPATDLDHYRPINGKGGGANAADNIRPICRECNQKRSHGWHGEVIATKEAEMLKNLKLLLHEAEGA